MDCVLRIGRSVVWLSALQLFPPALLLVLSLARKLRTAYGYEASCKCSFKIMDLGYRLGYRLAVAAKWLDGALF